MLGALGWIAVVAMVSCSGDDPDEQDCNPQNPGAFSCAALCEPLQCCGVLPDQWCFNGDCWQPDCEAECAEEAQDVLASALERLQGCFYERSCDELETNGAIDGYYECIDEVYFRSDAPLAAGRQQVCDDLEALAETACTGEDCEMNVSAVGSVCASVARFASDAVFAQVEQCASETGCFALADCVRDFHCARDYTGLKICQSPMIVDCD